MVLNKPAAQFTARLNSLDILRGWFLVVIACDHLIRIPSMFDLVTGRGLLWVSAAEGFFFISGMLVGIARGRQMQLSGLKAAAMHVWARAGKLYVASVVLTFAYLFLGYWLQSRGVNAIKGGLTHFSTVGDMLYNVLNLNYTYGWADFLSYYAVFLGLAPLALWLLRRKLWWVIVWVSLTLWLIKGEVTLPFLSFYALWQVYFFLGLVFGYHYHSLRSYYRLLTPRTIQLLRLGLITATVATVVASIAFTFGTPFFARYGPGYAGLLQLLHLPSPQTFYDFFNSVKENETFKELFQNERGGLLRLPIFLLWFGCLFSLVRQYEDWVVAKVGWLLLPLGKNSLYVYIIQSVLAFGVPLLYLPFGYVENTFINIAAVLICWVAVKRRFLFALIPR